MAVLQNALLLSHEYMENIVRPGSVTVDATCGNGHDTLFLSRLVGAGGRVYGFDIQEEALKNTRRRLVQANAPDNVTLFCRGHEEMESFVPTGIAAVMFNLGYLPGGDHRMATRHETSVRAIGAAARLLAPGGLITLCVYSGGDTGFEERDAVVRFCRSFDQRRFRVLSHEFINQENHPPLLLCIEKNSE